LHPAMALWTSLAYSFFPRPDSISTELVTTSVFQCRNRQFKCLPDRSSPRSPTAAGRAAGPSGRSAGGFHPRPAIGDQGGEAADHRECNVGRPSGHVICLLQGERCV
jgi:hypothetical protein